MPDVAPIGTAAAAPRLPAWCAAWSLGKRPPRSGFLAVGYFCIRVSRPCQQGLATTTSQDAPGNEAHDEHCRDSRNLPGSRQKPFSANTGPRMELYGAASTPTIRTLGRLRREKLIETTRARRAFEAVPCDPARVTRQSARTGLARLLAVAASPLSDGRIVARAPWLTQGYFKSKRTIQRTKRLLEAAHDAREPLVIDLVRCVALGVVMRVAVGRRVRHHQRMKVRCPERRLV